MVSKTFDVCIQVIAAIVAIVPLMLTLDDANLGPAHVITSMKQLLKHEHGITLLVAGTTLAATQDIKSSILVAMVVYAFLDWSKKGPASLDILDGLDVPDPFDNVDMSDTFDAFDQLKRK